MGFYTKATEPGDAFGRREAAEQLMKQLIEEPPGALPLVAGVFGAWGYGKTTFMRMMLDAGGTEDDSTKLLWFKPWLYERRQDVGVGLVYHLVDQIRATEPTGSKLKKKAWRVAKAFGKTLGGYAGSSINQAIPLAGPIKDAAIEAAQVAFHAEPELQSAVDQLLERLKGLIVDWVGDGRVVIFVDDLDRCLPDQMVRLLEAMHLYFMEIPAVFVLGVDRLALEAAIEGRFGASTGSRCIWHSIRNRLVFGMILKGGHTKTCLPSSTRLN